MCQNNQLPSNRLAHTSRGRWIVQLVAAVGLSLISGGALSAAVFQYTVPVKTAKGESTAYLWIPPMERQIRGVVMAGMTLMERQFAEDPQIRQACATEQLAIVFLKCGLGAAQLPQVLDDLAVHSGYRELSVAPLLFVGHSAGGPQAKAAAIEMAGRCFGLVLYRGGVPGGIEPTPPGIPVLMMLGQFDEFGGAMRDDAGREAWEGGRDALAAFRTKDERNLGSLVVEPGAGHFAWSHRNAAYLALFIRKAAQARIPNPWPIDAAQPVALRTIDPRRGWLTDLTIKTPGGLAPAPYDQYPGPKTNTAWHFDRELAQATLAYHAGDVPNRAATVRKRSDTEPLADARSSISTAFGKLDQFIQWQDPHWVDAGARFFFSKVDWVGDGQTFEVHPVYAATVPSQRDGKGPRWPQAGKPVGHSDSPILVRAVGGPAVAVGTNRLRLQFDALAPASDGSRVTLLAYSEGDGKYRYTEHIGMLPRGFRGLKSGKPQTISFAPIGNLKANAPPPQLQATSDAGLPVEFYVAYGPAIVTNGRLRIAELPTRAQYPLAVKVVAYQFGRGVEPRVQTAAPVEQIVRIESP